MSVGTGAEINSDEINPGIKSTRGRNQPGDKINPGTKSTGDKINYRKQYCDKYILTYVMLSGYN